MVPLLVKPKTTLNIIPLFVGAIFFLFPISPLKALQKETPSQNEQDEEEAAAEPVANVWLLAKAVWCAKADWFAKTVWCAVVVWCVGVRVLFFFELQ